MNIENKYYISHLRLILLISEKLASFDIIEDDSQLFPKIDVYNRNISFSNSTSVYLTLLQFGSPKLAMAYALLFRAASLHQYEIAEELLTDIGNEIEQDKKDIIKRCKKAGYMITCEMLFLFYHEIAHGLFATDSEIKEKHLSLVTDNEVKYSVDYTFKNFSFSDVNPKIVRYLVRKLYPLRTNLKRRVCKLALKDEKKEEIACDIFAMAEWIKYADKQVGLREFHLANLLFSVTGIYMTHTHMQNLELEMKGKSYDFYNNEEALVIASRKNFIFLKVTDLIMNMCKNNSIEEIYSEMDKIINLSNFQVECSKSIIYYQGLIESIKKEGAKYVSKKRHNEFLEKLSQFNSIILEFPEISPEYNKTKKENYASE